MDNKILIKNLMKNTEIVYENNLNVELVKLSILYSERHKMLDIFGEIIGEENASGINVMTIFITYDKEYNERDESDTLYSTFPGIQSFKCSLRLEDALTRCQKLKIKIERKVHYARDKYRGY